MARHETDRVRSSLDANRQHRHVLALSARKILDLARAGSSRGLFVRNGRSKPAVDSSCSAAFSRTSGRGIGVGRLLSNGGRGFGHRCTRCDAAMDFERSSARNDAECYTRLRCSYASACEYLIFSRLQTLRHERLSMKYVIHTQFEFAESALWNFAVE